MTRQLTVTVRHPPTDELETKTFDVPEKALNLGMLADYAEVMAGYAKQAVKDIASRHVEFESFQGDSAYLDALDKLADSYRIESISLSGEKKRWYVQTLYPEHMDGGYFSEYADAVDEMEAQFLVAWKQGVDGGGESTDTYEEFRDLTEYMGDVEIVSVTMVSLNDDLPVGDLVSRTTALLKAIESGEGLDEAIADAQSALELYRILTVANELVNAVETGEHLETVTEQARQELEAMKLIEPAASAAPAKPSL